MNYDLDWSYGEIGLIFGVSKGIVHRGFLCHRRAQLNDSQVPPLVGDHYFRSIRLIPRVRDVQDDITIPAK
jgi:hypothetical protein